MPRILVSPDQLRALGARLRQVCGDLRGVEGRVGNALGGLAWEARQKAGVDGQANHARSQARALAAQAEEMGRYLERKAQVFEDADRQSVTDLEVVIDKYPIPTPTPTPTPTPVQGEEREEENGPFDSIEEAISSLADWLEPIDWVSKHKKAAKAFREVFEQIGRVLNLITGKRGHIKLMGELSDVLIGTAKTVDAVGNLIDLKDCGKYFAGELTNRELGHTAIKAIINTPVLGDKVADWVVKNMPDPNGRWQGLVPTVE